MSTPQDSSDATPAQPACDVPGCRIRVQRYRHGSEVHAHFHPDPSGQAGERLAEVYRILLRAAVQWRERDRAAGRDPDSPAEIARRKQALIYARARSAAVLQAEVDRLREIAADEKLEVADERVIAERADRVKGTPGVAEVLARAEASEYGTLIVSDHRSIGRHFREGGEAQERLKQLGVRVMLAYSFLPMRVVSEEWIGDESPSPHGDHPTV